MSRRVCETCQWFVTSDFGGVDGCGICAYMEHLEPHTAKRWVISPASATEGIRREMERIRREEDWCEHWEREKECER